MRRWCWQWGCAAEHLDTLPTLPSLIMTLLNFCFLVHPFLFCYHYLPPPSCFFPTLMAGYQREVALSACDSWVCKSQSENQEVLLLVLVEPLSHSKWAEEHKESSRNSTKGIHVEMNHLPACPCFRDSAGSFWIWSQYCLDVFSLICLLWWRNAQFPSFPS